MTAGGCSDKMPVWHMDKNVVMKWLNSAYGKKIVKRSLSCGNSTTCLQNRKATLVGFKEFTSDPTPNAESELHTLLLYEDDNLAFALKCALEKVGKEASSVVQPATRTLHPDTTASSRKW